MENTDTSWKGNCYRNAVDFIEGGYKKFPDINPDELRIVHGKVMGHGKENAGHIIVHAWVEDNNFCYDHNGRTNNVEQVAKIIYYTLGRIQIVETKRYTRQQMYEHLTEVEHCGPWDAGLLVHARNEHGSIYKED